jgi:biopolymer transport protein ExbD
MAEINQSVPQGRSGKVRVKKMSLKIDMTPMVDLAFLLLTFFILTSTLTKVTIMDLSMPDVNTTEPPPRVPAAKVLNIALDKNDKILWWMGIDPRVSETDYSRQGIRKLLMDKKSEIEGLVVLIKPKDESRYQNIVDLLDEIDITNTERYTIVDFSEEDKILTRQ